MQFNIMEQAGGRIRAGARTGLSDFAPSPAVLIAATRLGGSRPFGFDPLRGSVSQAFGFSAAFAGAAAGVDAVPPFL